MVDSQRQKVTLNLASDVVRAYRLAAVRQGMTDQSLIETALREYLGLNALKDLQASFAHLELSEADADRMAVAAVRSTRLERSKTMRADVGKARASR